MLPGMEGKPERAKKVASVEPEKGTAQATPGMKVSAAPATKSNVLYYGDNLDIFWDDYIAQGSIDLIYLDPPFNSKKKYSVIFKDESGRKFDAQPMAFDDTWHWGPTAREHLRYLSTTTLQRRPVPPKVTDSINAMKDALGENPMTAYLVEMTIRLVEMWYLLKPTGSLFLHCDPTASHYLKLILDSLFGPKQFRNEIVWAYWGPGSPGQRQFSRKHDTILWYSKGEKWTWNADAVRIPHADKTLENYKEGLVGSGFVAGDTEAKRALAEGGKIPEDWWPIAIAPRGKEYLGYPTQKPLKLLERIIRAASNPGDVVLDPFCGCGTALVAAHELGRRWIGIDVTYLAISVMSDRLKSAFDGTPNALDFIEIIGDPTEVEGARALAKQDEQDGRYQFQWWAVHKLGGTPVSGTKKKGADRGRDGLMTFTDKAGETQKILINVKSGGVGVKDIREFDTVLKNEGAAMGIFVTLEDPTKPMTDAAGAAGIYTSEAAHPFDPTNVMRADFPRIQIITVTEMLEEKKRPLLPPFLHRPYQRAAAVADNLSLWASADGASEDSAEEDDDEDDEE